MDPHGSQSGSGEIKEKVSWGPSTGSLVGAKLGSYKVLEVIGSGGMGKVYAAEHVVIGRKAAIKVLGDVSPGRDAISRFLTEARAVNQIRHPNIVEVTDYGTVEGQPYIVMEYLKGETLADRLERERLLDPLVAVHIARQVASALNAAHEAGLVHRDLKPANVFLCQHADYPDFVKVLDFGIAKLVGSQMTVNHRTKVGALLGTPSYMSPEQCLGDLALDHRSDIYSLGVLVYLMVTGQLPFEDDSVGRLILAHVNMPPRPPAMLRATLSPELSRAIMKALEKRPKMRYTSMREFRCALDGAVGLPQQSPSNPLPPALFADLPAPAPSSSRQIAEVSVTPEPDPSVDTTGVHTARVVAKGRSEEEAALVRKLGGLVAECLTLGKLVLPSLPRAAQACLEALSRPTTRFPEIVAQLAADKTIASRLVALTRGTSERSPSVEQAVAQLGPQGLPRALVQIALRPVLEPAEERIRTAFERPFAHAVAVGILAERLATLIARPELGPSLHLGGLLHDVGRPLVASALLDIERKRAAHHGQGWLTQAVWQRTIDENFRPVSAALAQLWGLPPRVVRAIERGVGTNYESPRSSAAALAHAVVLANKHGFALRPEHLEDVDVLLELGRRALGIGPAAEAKLVEGVEEEVARVEAAVPSERLVS